MEGNYISINLPNIVTICIAAALGMFVIGAISSGLRQYKAQ